MTKLRTFALLVFSLVLTLSFASAYYDSYNPYSTYGYSSSYSETPGYNQYPDYQSSNSANSNYANTNYDSSNYQNTYYGPMFERTTTYSDDLLIDKSSKSGFFTSNNKDIVKRSVSQKTTEKYVGESETTLYGTQNRQATTNTNSRSANTNYDGGFSWGKARVFDESEYSRDSYGSRSYYDPFYSNGYYNWRW